MRVLGEIIVTFLPFVLRVPIHDVLPLRGIHYPINDFLHGYLQGEISGRQVVMLTACLSEWPVFAARQVLATIEELQSKAPYHVNADLLMLRTYCEYNFDAGIWENEFRTLQSGVNRTHALGALALEGVNFNRSSLLHYAVNSNNRQLVLFLIRCKVNLDVRDVAGDTPLSRCIKSHNLEMAELLLQAGASPDERFGPENETLLHSAIQSDDVEVAELLIRFQADLNAKTLDDESPLFLSCVKQNMSIFLALLQAGALVDAENGELGQTVLHLAAIRCDILAAKLLLRYNADCNAKDRDGLTPLYSACKMGDPDPNFLRLLLQSGAKVDEPNGDDKETALHMAAFENDTATIELLIEHKASIDARQIEGQTALHIACSVGGWEAVQALLAKGADKFLFCEKGFSCLDYVAMADNSIRKMYRIVNDERIPLCYDNDMHLLGVFLDKNDIRLAETCAKEHQVFSQKNVLAQCYISWFDESFQKKVEELDKTKALSYEPVKLYRLRRICQDWYEESAKFTFNIDIRVADTKELKQRFINSAALQEGVQGAIDILTKLQDNLRVYREFILQQEQFLVQKELPQAPSEFFCSITQEVMKDPVRDKRHPEHLYERKAIVAWINKSPISPLNRASLTLDDLESAADMKAKIVQWHKELLQHCQQKQRQLQSDLEKDKAYKEEITAIIAQYEQRKRLIAQELEESK